MSAISIIDTQIDCCVRPTPQYPYANGAIGFEPMYLYGIDGCFLASL